MHPYPAPNPATPRPKWARKRVALPALLVAFSLGVAAGPDDEKGPEKTSAAVAPQPTVTVTVEAKSTPKPVPTVTKTVTKTVTVTETADPDPAPARGAVGGDDARSSVFYSNCTAAKAAGDAPLYRGDPGYGSHLDRDNDGDACE